MCSIVRFSSAYGYNDHHGLLDNLFRLHEYPMNRFPCAEYPYSFLHSALQTGYSLVVVPAFAIGVFGLAQRKPQNILLVFLVAMLLIQPIWEYIRMVTRWSASAVGPAADPFSYFVLSWGAQALFNITAFVTIPAAFGSVIHRAIGARNRTRLANGWRSYWMD